MAHDITIYKTPPLDVSIDELVARLQDKFGAEGSLDGLVRSTIDREVERELAVNKEVFREILMRDDNWETFFPGVCIADTNIDAEIERFMEEKRPVLTAILHDYVMRRAVVAGTPSLNLIVSSEDVQRNSNFPCNGKPHCFAYSRKTYTSFVISEDGETHYHRERFGLDPSALFFIRKIGKMHPRCGKLRRQVTIATFPCTNTTGCNVVKLDRAHFSYYCELCGESRTLRRIWKPHQSPYVQQTLLDNKLTLLHY